MDFVIFTTKDLTYVYNSICKFIWVLNNDGHLVEAAFADLVFPSWTHWNLIDGDSNAGTAG